MILDVFPSYKDKDMVDLLYQYERTTGRSLNILVEKYLEKLLYEKGYMTKSIDENNQEQEVSLLNKEHFKTLKKNGRISISINGLEFGTYLPDIVEEIVTSLARFGIDELKSFSLDKWKGTRNEYYNFLQSKFKNPSLSIDDYFRESDCNIYKCREAFCIRKSELKYGSYNSIEKAREVRNFLAFKGYPKKYSSNVLNLRGDKYKEYLFLEMEKDSDGGK